MPAALAEASIKVKKLKEEHDKHHEECDHFLNVAQELEFTVTNFAPAKNFMKFKCETLKREV